MNQEKIGKFISKIRKEKNLTQEDLANSLGVSINAVSKWERGICLMDMSLLNPLCKKLDITVNELLSGEKITYKELSEKSNENIINVLKELSKIHKKEKILITIFLIFVMFIIFLLLFFQGYNYGINKEKYDSLVNFSTKVTDNCKGNITEYYKIGDETIYYYCLDNLVINDNITLKEYFKHTKNNGYFKFLINHLSNPTVDNLFDGGTIEYHTHDITIIKCNTLDGNKDIYFGPYDMNVTKAYNNGVCGKGNNNESTFTKTYNIESISSGEEENIYYVTLSLFQSYKDIALIKTSQKLEVGKNYEFTFKNSNYNINEDKISSIFENAELIKIEKTEKLGLDQIQDSVK